MRERQRGERSERQPLARDGGHVGEVRQVPRGFRRRQSVANRAEPNEILLGFAILMSLFVFVFVRVGFFASLNHRRFPSDRLSRQKSRRDGRTHRRGRLGQEKTHAHHVPAVPSVHVPKRVDVVQTLGVTGRRVIDRGRGFKCGLRLGFRVVFRLGVDVRGVGVGVASIRRAFRKRLVGIRLAHEDQVVVVEPRHGVLAQNELHDVEPVHARATEHRADRAPAGTPRLFFVPARYLRRALLQNQRLEHVEVLVHGGEGLRHVAQSSLTRRVRARLPVVHGEVVPRKHLLLQTRQVRGLLLRGERHGDNSAEEAGRRRSHRRSRRRVRGKPLFAGAVSRARNRRAKARGGGVARPAPALAEAARCTRARAAVRVTRAPANGGAAAKLGANR